MQDKIEKLSCGSIIQHGKLSDRIYLMKLNFDKIEETLQEIDKLADKNGYSKLFCKVPVHAAPIFFIDGFVQEAFIPKFYKGEEDALFLAKYRTHERATIGNKDNYKVFAKVLEAKSKPSEISHNYDVIRLNESHVNEMTEVFKEIFESYPFPIHDPNYLLETMKEDVQYYGVIIEGELAAISSAEIDRQSLNAEMTDFAIRTKFQGRKLSEILLAKMEEDMPKEGIRTLYTIARLNSIPMNKTFLRLDYIYSGTLKNNTNIAGAIESMNVLYKNL